MKDLAGKTAFITGGASGIGLAMARAFGREGMNVVISDVDAAALGAASQSLEEQQIRVASVVCDVADRASVQAAAKAAVEAFGKVHVVCNNAGVGVAGLLGEVRQADWDWVFDVNIMGVIYGVESFAPLLMSHGEGGHFVNTSSMAGFLTAPGMEAYAASKHAVVAMSEGWAPQLAARGIGMSVLCPHFVRTRIHESERVRPERFASGAAAPVLDPAQSPVAQGVLAGIDPDVVGARVVEAILGEEFYIFTHPQARPLMEGYFAGVLAAFDKAAASPALQSIKDWVPPQMTRP
jgi:NAD(P)-dependent dehydrogenase (short-subunit alcohol dehydrogenase family)